MAARVVAQAVPVADGFLGRWSQRKQALREGRAVEEAPAPNTEKPAAAAAGANPGAGLGTLGPGAQPVLLSTAGPENDATPGAPAAQVRQPAPTLEDVNALTADSSFAPFVARDVAPEVRNAAMKKLFTDPHYNVMDGLDIYIDDYSRADPMPADMLRQMVSAKFLNLFDEDPPSASGAVPPGQTLREDAHTAAAGSVAQSVLPPATLPTPTCDVGSPIEDTPHDHTDLRLQPDHAARPEGLERKPE